MRRRCARRHHPRPPTEVARPDAIDSALFAVLTLLGGWYPLAKSVAFVVATSNGYFWNRRWTFDRARQRAARPGQVPDGSGSTFLLNLVLLAVAVEGVGVHPLEAQAVRLPVTFALAYLGQRFWTFRAHLHHPAPPSRQSEEPVVGPL